MKTTLAWIGAALLMAGAASAQNYAIDWFTVAGGGGTSTGGVFSVSGTIGQADASPMTMNGGSYSLIGGFWGVVIPVQQVEAPTLFAQNLQNGSVKLYWAPNPPGFVLQEAGTLNATQVAWSNAPSAYTNGVIIPGAMQTRFFRLIKP